MNNEQVQKLVSCFAGDICSPLWGDHETVPDGMPLRISTILAHDHAFLRYVFSHRDEVSDFQLESIQSMFRCINNECGGITYICPDCGVLKFIPFHCHSRVCPRCGKRYAERWGRWLMDRFLPVPHRHIIFTLPEDLWGLVGAKSDVLIEDMLEASKTVIERLLRDRFKGKKVRIGMISIVHYTGRDMKFNPHIHMLVTEGVLLSNGEWKPHWYFPYMKMCSYWKYEVLKRFRFHCRDSLEIKSIIDRQWKYSFKNGTSGYVVKNFRHILDVKNFGSYLARYVRHPPIGESRLLGFDGEYVKIKYEWDNKIVVTSVSLDRFIGGILSNIPPKGFKIVREYGLYSNVLYRWALMKITGMIFFQTRLDDYSAGVERQVVRCARCKVVMEPILIEYVVHGQWVWSLV